MQQCAAKSPYDVPTGGPAPNRRADRALGVDQIDIRGGDDRRVLAGCVRRRGAADVPSGVEAPPCAPRMV